MSKILSNYPRNVGVLTVQERARLLVGAFSALHWTVAWVPIGFYAWHSQVFPFRELAQYLSFGPANNSVIGMSILVVGIALQRKPLLTASAALGLTTQQTVGLFLAVFLGNLFGFGFLGFYGLQVYLYVRLRRLRLSPGAFGNGPNDSDVQKHENFK